jgi:hypothetical protein
VRVGIGISSGWGSPPPRKGIWMNAIPLVSVKRRRSPAIAVFIVGSMDVSYIGIGCEKK